MTDSKLRIDERDVAGVTILTLAGEMSLDDGDLTFGRRVNDLVSSGRVKILVDLDAVTTIDSSGVGMMAAKLKDVRRSGGDIRLMRLNTRHQRLLSVLKLRTVFEIFDDEAVALRSYEFRPHA